MIRARYRSIAWGALCVGLAGVLATEIAMSEEKSEQPRAAMAKSPSSPKAAMTPVLDANAIQTMVAAMLARPLFNPSRKPEAAKIAASPDAEPARLTAILISGEVKRAIFQPQGKGPLAILAEGGNIGGWTVDNIAEDSVSISGPAGERKLKPKFEPGLQPAGLAMNPSNPAPQISLAQPADPAAAAPMLNPPSQAISSKPNTLNLFSRPAATP